MATTAVANDEASRTTTKIIDASLWWDSFQHLLAELESASLSSDLPPPLEKKIKENHAWFLDTVSLFKLPNLKSRDALDASRLKIGVHQITVETEKKAAALKISSALCLDEVQSYILVDRTMNQKGTVADGVFHELPHLVMIQYYLERQCLIKCTRQIIMQALYIMTRSQDASIVDEAQKLISDGLDWKLFSVLQENLSCNFPENMDVDLYTLWAEEIVTEDNLVLDVLFLIFYEFCPCSVELWKKLCSLYEGFISNSYNFGKLAVSVEAVSSIYHAKLQLLLILIETLDLENLLQMVHDETPFRQGCVTFSLSEVEEIDAMVSTFDVFKNKESGPLVLAWAVFLCLISSLPGKEGNNILMEIDHIGYVRQAFEAGCLGSFLEIIENDMLRNFDGPITGFRSVLRTFLSTFIASYEINLQLEGGNLKLILDILCKIYQTEESLCTQFWDRESFVDGPIRCLLCSLEGEFPFRTTELLQLLSALCEGAWPAECVFNFLDKSTGLSSPVAISNCSIVNDASQTVMVVQPLQLPGIEGLVIPSGTRGHLLKMIDRDIALVRWEFSQSGIFVLLLRLAQELYLEKTSESVMTLGLISRLVNFNMGVCYSLLGLDGYVPKEMNSPTEHLRVNVAEIICAWIKSLSPNFSGVVLMSMAVNILAKMLKCSPYHVSGLIVQANIFDVAFKTNPFKVGSNGLSSGSWLLSGRLAKMLLIDCEQNDCQLTLSVLDFTMQLVDSGMENDVVLALVTFSIQFVLVNHEFWNYKIKHTRWKVTLKVLEVLKKCISSISYIQKLGEGVKDILFGDSSIHNALFRLVCTTSDGLEKLYFSRLYGLTDIEGLQQAIILGLDILSSMLSDISRVVPNFSVFCQTVMSLTAKPMPVVTAAISLMSFFQNPKIQVGAARLLSSLFIIGDNSQSYGLSNAYFGLDDKQIYIFKNTICSILCQEKVVCEDLIIATFKMLTSAALYQASFLTAVIALEENPISESCNGDNHPTNNDALQCNVANILDCIWIYVKRLDDLVLTKSHIMCNVLNFLKALWQGAAYYTNLLEQLRNSDFWKKLLNCVVLSTSFQSESTTELELQNLAYRYQCQRNVLDVVAYEMFLQKKVLYSELVTTESSKCLRNGSDGSKVGTAESSCNLKEISGVWCASSLDAETIKRFVSFEYDDSVKLRARVAAGLFAVRVMCKVKGGDRGSLSVSLVVKVTNLWQKMRKLPVFSELMAIYMKHGYSGGNEVDDLILSDLFYHLQGELEGRQISHMPFKELSQYLLQSNFLQAYCCKHHEDSFPQTDGVCLYDTDRLQGDMAIDLWDHSDWKESKAVAEMLLLSLKNVNLMVSLTKAKLSALIALAATFSISDNDNASFVSPDTEIRSGRKIPEKSLSSSIDYICQSLHHTIELLPPVSDASEDIVDILAAQAQLLFLFTRSLSTELSLSTCLVILKTSGYGLKMLSNCRPLVTAAIFPMKIFSMLILFSLKSSWRDSHPGVQTNIEHDEALPEAANVSLGLLPLICNCIELTEHCSISVVTIDQIVKGFSTPATWFPIIQKYLPMQRIVLKLQDKSSYSNIGIILKFLLTIAHVKEGAEMLVNTGFFASLSMLLADLSNGGPLSVVEWERNLANTFENNERSQPIWGLSLAVVTAIINSLGECSIFNVEHVVTYFLLEKADLISYYLSALDFPPDVHDKKRLRALKPHTSLSALREIENTVMLICVLAKHRNTWSRAMKEMESQLRERCIHLLAFISCGTPHHGESPGRVSPIFCHPTLREEYEWHKKPSSINSKNGWFACAAYCCGLNPKYSYSSSRSDTVIKDQPNEHANLTSQTHFSDVVSIQIYRITCLLLKFLCQQAEYAAERAEEVGFVDLAHFPELPMPDILHCLQDQGISIVTELCEANKLKQVTSEVQVVCILLFQITVMALYLEFCVIQICGMRPVHGRVEDFSKEFYALTKAMEGHAFLKESMNSLKKMVSYVYPELLQAEAVV